MGSIAATKGTVRLRDCLEVRPILKVLGELAEGMDEMRVEIRKTNRRKYGPGVLEVDTGRCGYPVAFLRTARRGVSLLDGEAAGNG